MANARGKFSDIHHGAAYCPGAIIVHEKERVINLAFNFQLNIMDCFVFRSSEEDDGEAMAEELSDRLQDFLASRSLASELQQINNHGRQDIPRMPDEPLSDFNIFFYEQRHRILTRQAMNERELESFVRSRYSMGIFRPALPPMEQLVETDSFGVMALYIVSLWERERRQGSSHLYLCHRLSELSYNLHLIHNLPARRALTTFNIFFFEQRHLLRTGESLNQSRLEQFVTARVENLRRNNQEHLGLDDEQDVCGIMAHSIISAWKQVEASNSDLRYIRLSEMSWQLHDEAMRRYLSENNREP